MDSRAKRERTSGRQQGRPTGRLKRKRKVDGGRRRFLKGALGWVADHAAGGLVAQATLVAGSDFLRRATSPVITPAPAVLSFVRARDSVSVVLNEQGSVWIVPNDGEAKRSSED